MPPPPGPDWHGYGTSSRATFQHLLAEAIADIAEHGYTSAERIEQWMSRLRQAAEFELGAESAIEDAMRTAMRAIYTRMVERGRVEQLVPGVSKYTLQMVQPQLRAEVDRRIIASADLIKVRRREAVEKTLARFRGWSTSIPPGGGNLIDKRETRSDLGKSISQFRFEKRRVEIDQGHKLVSNISNVVAIGNGAIAAEWHSHWRQPNYAYRHSHKDRDLKVYAIKDNWAISQGLMTKGAGYTDEITAPGVEVFCRCWYRYISSLRRLPDNMLTQKGREWLAEAAAKRAA